MLWRARTTLSDRPGSLATLARQCGERDVNILGLQIFPGIGGVTDELVLRAPDGWDASDVARLIRGAGGDDVTVARCSEHALVDGPIQYLHALRRLAHDAATLPEVLATLLDAVPDGGLAERADEADELDVTVGSERVELRRTAPFTATEHARAVAFAEIATDLLAGHGGYGGGRAADRLDHPKAAPPLVRRATVEDTGAVIRMHQRCSADSIYRRYAAPLATVDDRFARRLLLAGGGALVASLGGEVVGIASRSMSEAGTAEVSVLVEDGWQRQGVGSRLLTAAARLARGDGAREMVLRSRTHTPALMSLVFAAGLRARIRLDGDTVVATVGVEGLKPWEPRWDTRTGPAPTPA